MKSVLLWLFLTPMMDFISSMFGTVVGAVLKKKAEDLARLATSGEQASSGS